jgi:NAD(P)-dependent dehydrogenase (short-subunit alcohol dehydrogenase family)
MSRAVLPHMIRAGGGSIIHVASQMGRVGAAGRPAYCATKGA